jgi:signal transduction histidine kinase
MLRRFRGCTVEIQSLNNISVIKQAEDDPYKAPMLYTSPLSDMRAINRYGRRRINGTVIATCSDRRILIQTDQGDTHGIHFLSAPLPSCGDRIEAVGIPEADYYQINLLDAIWRHAEGVALPKASPVDVTLKHLLTDGKGHAQINQNFHGKTVRLCGTIIDMPSLESGRDFAILKDSGETVLIDISSARDILATVTSGCRVRVTGICTANRDSSVNPQMKFLQLNGITIVIRSPDDIEILEHPPWWTPGRLAVVVTMLLILLVAIIIWNRVLRAVIDRKSRSLIREELSQVKLALRIDERTHLAIELHDSLSQNLSGIACQIAATKGLVPEESSEIARYLSIAERMLGSCRNELRRCIWDLRENALDEKDFSEAIRKTLDPVSIGSEVTVEVDVPRSHIDDSTAHSILCIIRELVTNAIYHGKASSVNVTGAINGHTLRFSVVDNGSGFDTTAAPNANEGHFGLEGIRERIKRMNGAFDLKSSPGNGCSAVITISTSRSNER